MKNKKITEEELLKILEDHQKWLYTRFSEKVEGRYANLEGANFKGANLEGANLEGANFKDANLEDAYLIGANFNGAYLIGANLEGANFKGAAFRGAYFRGANFKGANFEGAYLIGANFNGANLEGANFKDAAFKGANLIGANFKGAYFEGAYFEGANLIGANFRGANLEGADLDGADFRGANLEGAEDIRKGLILKEPMIVYKKIILSMEDDISSTILKLEIPIGAIVFSINNSKCRTNKAKVLEIERMKDGMTAHSKHDYSFNYEVGQEIEIENFNLMYNVECASGIHFFRTREEAEAY